MKKPFCWTALIIFLFTGDLLLLAAEQNEPESLIATKNGDKYGYADRSGKFIIPPQFEIAYSFIEGLAGVRTDSKWGWIDKTGKFVIPAQFDDYSYFSEGLAPVKSADKYGYIDKTGKSVIPPQFERAYSFIEGLAPARSGGKYGWIDKTGKFIIPAQFYDIDLFGSFNQGPIAVKSDSGWGYIDRTGRFVVQPQFYEAKGFSEGLAVVGIPFDYLKHGMIPQVTYGVQIDSVYMERVIPLEYGYIDINGVKVIECQFEIGRAHV